MALCPGEWRYLEEGGAHIIFAYTGDNVTFVILTLNMFLTFLEGQGYSSCKSIWLEPEYR